MSIFINFLVSLRSFCLSAQTCPALNEKRHPQSEEEQDQQKPSILKKHCTKQLQPNPEAPQHHKTGDSRNTKRSSFPSGDCASLPRDVSPPDIWLSRKDGTHRHIVKHHQPKQSYGALEESSGLEKKSDKEERARNQSNRNDKCRETGANTDTGTPQSLDGDDGSDDNDAGDSGDQAVISHSDDVLCVDDSELCSNSSCSNFINTNYKKSCVTSRNNRADESSVSSQLVNACDKDDDVDNDINENVGLVSGIQRKEKPVSSTPSVTFRGCNTKAQKTSASSFDDDDADGKPQTGKTKFARLIGLYKRDIKRSSKSTCIEGTKPESSQGCGGVRKSSGSSTSNPRSPCSPLTPTIQVTTPALTDVVPPPSAPLLKSALVKSPRSTDSRGASLSSSTPTASSKHPLPNTAKHKVSFITGLRRFSREKAAFLRVDHTENKPKTVPTSAPTYLFPALPLKPTGESSAGKQTSSTSQAPTGSRRGAGLGSRRKLKVEFAVMESEVVVENSRGIRGRGRWGVMGPGGVKGGEFEDSGGGGVFSLKDDVENDVAMLGGNRARFRQARLSLLGKPLNYKAHRRDMRYRRLQSRIYNFLERPKSWGSWFYHLAM
ncbi:potassium voltage-gated channel subfamily KQT member 5 [Elysia marginata]|uniref:Potassium voltage-gated channel subfamily KQT member 5 n=1 Tax=Elysia marginata TaxID=1093978 RepID=A0AAV4IFG4_9GAST|nr:potassium voltage-gated channel subfamily KQT member 5 [Elysia marginata]